MKKVTMDVETSEVPPSALNSTHKSRGCISRAKTLFFFFNHFLNFSLGEKNISPIFLIYFRNPFVVGHTAC